MVKLKWNKKSFHRPKEILGKYIIKITRDKFVSLINERDETVPYTSHVTSQDLSLLLCKILGLLFICIIVLPEGPK